MFCKLMVLTTNCGGMQELVTDGETGFLVPTRNPDLMALKIEHIMSLQEEVCMEITQQARLKVEQQHNVQKMVSDMEKLYKKVK